MSVAMEDWPRRHRITVDEYHRMAEVGLLAPDARVELIEGEIVEMPPIGSRHGAAVARLTEALVREVGQRAIVWCQTSIQLGADSEPQPDLALLARRQDFYEQQLPTGADTLLVIEVSDSTLLYDLRRKASLCAKHGIPELWVIDVERRQLHVFDQISSALSRWEDAWKIGWGQNTRLADSVPDSNCFVALRKAADNKGE